MMSHKYIYNRSRKYAKTVSNILYFSIEYDGIHQKSSYCVSRVEISGNRAKFQVVRPHRARTEHLEEFIEEIKLRATAQMKCAAAQAHGWIFRGKCGRTNLLCGHTYS